MFIVHFIPFKLLIVMSGKSKHYTNSYTPNWFKKIWKYLNND